MKVQITAVQANGQMIRANRETFGMTPEAVLANWISKNPTCTRAALGDQPAAVETRSVRASGGSSTLLDLDGTALAASKCETCGVTTLSNKNNKSAARVHRVGCAAMRAGDFVTTMGGN